MQQLQEENVNLKRQVDLAKQQLIKLETSNGKVQIAVPGQIVSEVPAQQTTGPQQVQEQPKQDHKDRGRCPRRQRRPAHRPAGDAGRSKSVAGICLGGFPER